MSELGSQNILVLIGIWGKLKIKKNKVIYFFSWIVFHNVNRSKPIVQIHNQGENKIKSKVIITVFIFTYSTVILKFKLNLQLTV